MGCEVPSRLVGYGHGHEVLIADLDDPIQVAVPHSEGVAERTQHDAALDEVVELEALLGQSIKPCHHQLAEGHSHSEAHLGVGRV